MMLKKEKTLKISLLLLSLLTTNVRICYAEHRVSFGTIGENTPIPDVPYKDWTEIKKGNKKYEYTYKELVITNNAFVVDVINLEGKSVINTTNVATESFKAGTWAGLNITETQSASWVVSDFKYRETKKKYTCKYEKPASTYKCEKQATMNESSCSGTFSPHYPGFNYGICTYETTCTSPSGTKEYSPEPVDYYAPSPCDATHPDDARYKYVDETVEDVTGDETPTSGISADAEQAAIAAAQTKASGLVSTSIGIVNYIKNNKHPGSVDKLSYDSISATSVGERTTSGWGTKQGSIMQKYEYRQENVCMNVKTSEVSYGEQCKASEGQIQIKNGTTPNKKTYWHYFIPLNTKTSDDNFFVQITSNPNRKLSIAECKDVIEKYETNYRDYIVPNAVAQEGITNSFTGAYRQDLAIIERNEGCYFSTTIRVPVKQKFYNEIDDGNTKKLKGFNFYYKPIEINNPFPNGINETSLWKDWYERKNEKPNLGDSYSAITYKALNINANAIRNYNKNNLYTEWTKMNMDGTSKYIDNNSSIQRNGNIKVYKLGCGKENENEFLESGEKNPLYQEWCDNS